MLVYRWWLVGHKIDMPAYACRPQNRGIITHIVFQLLGPFQLPNRAYLVEGINEQFLRQDKFYLVSQQQYNGSHEFIRIATWKLQKDLAVIKSSSHLNCQENLLI